MLFCVMDHCPYQSGLYCHFFDCDVDVFERGCGNLTWIRADIAYRAIKEVVRTGNKEASKEEKRALFIECIIKAILFHYPNGIDKETLCEIVNSVRGDILKALAGRKKK